MLVLVLGQLISNAATALIVIPIAVSAPADIDIPASPAVGVADPPGRVPDPVATPANLMVMEPGATASATTGSWACRCCSVRYRCRPARPRDLGLLSNGALELEGDPAATSRRGDPASPTTCGRSSPTWPERCAPRRAASSRASIPPSPVFLFGICVAARAARCTARATSRCRSRSRASAKPVRLRAQLAATECAALSRSSGRPVPRRSTIYVWRSPVRPLTVVSSQAEADMVCSLLRERHRLCRPARGHLGRGDGLRRLDRGSRRPGGPAGGTGLLEPATPDLFDTRLEARVVHGPTQSAGPVEGRRVRARARAARCAGSSRSASSADR